MRFVESAKRDVVSTADAETVGRVDAFVVDPASQRVSALKLSRTPGKEHYVSWSDLGSFGRDVVTVPSADVLRAAADDRESQVDKAAGVLGKRVLSDTGRELGEVKDVEFDASTGAITALLTDRDEIAGDRLRGVGSYAVVVRRSST